VLVQHREDHNQTPMGNNKSMVARVSQIMSKTKTFLLNQHLTCTDYGIYVATCVPCHEQYVGQTKNNFPRDGHRTAVIGTDLLVKMTKTRKWPEPD